MTKKAVVNLANYCGFFALMVIFILIIAADIVATTIKGDIIYGLLTVIVCSNFMAYLNELESRLFKLGLVLVNLTVLIGFDISKGGLLILAAGNKILLIVVSIYFITMLLARKAEN